ncbi:hypothetical protein Aple_032020 [Acrocarpospora pleiomorpha]|uniref:DUF305 domain-containing protein n=1 Tax=Acrocarpospora pleiomorpha TaxID=90975 RepID=A0A5M3XHW9_9ACTN|nr:DUF305 domain-containing protein [Acrocarpospora pleiomorpha]GES20306.1 hypothetical protein Aple_032020 [Acrocarpospora pleiomorpha]
MFNSRPSLRRAALTVAAGAGAVVLLAACGGDDSVSGQDMTGGTPAAAAAGAQPGASFNDADVMFAQMMIPHHQQAVEMAELAETRAGDAEVRDLAAKIKAAQDPEIVMLRGRLTAWGEPEAPEGGHSGHSMPGMMPEDDMKKLEASTGAEFDRLFSQLMIVHHNGAIEMARTEQAQGADPEAKALARTIGTAQRAEVERMQKIIDRL